MRDDLVLYYERELTYLRQLASQFAESYPKIASRLVLEATKSEDPHVERILEGFAFLAARVHLKIEDDFPEITESLLGVIYPQYIRPVPSMSIVEFQLDPEQGGLTSGLDIKRGSVLYSKPVAGVPCKFRTCYDTTLWPVTVTSGDWIGPERLPAGLRSGDIAGAIRLRLQAPSGVPFYKLKPGQLRFYLHGDGALVHHVYELLCCKLLRIVIRNAGKDVSKTATAPGSSVVPIGFQADEGMYDYTARSFTGYRLLQEYFAFPEKFFFIDVRDVEHSWIAAGVSETAELYFVFSSAGTDDARQRLELGINERTFRLSCVPIVNLFHQTAEPILLDQKKFEYSVTPDVHRPLATEIYSIDEVVASSDSGEILTYTPFYAPRAHGDGKAQRFYLAARRPSARANDSGSDMFISLVDAALRFVDPEADTLTVRTTCTNRDLPARLPFGHESGDFEYEGNAPLKRISALKKPTTPMRAPSGRGTLWNLTSHLSLNYLSLVDGGREALQQILRLYDFTGSAYTQRTVDGIASVRSRPHFARIISEHGVSFARGTAVDLELDEEQFVGGGVYLFASILEQFLGLYSSLNSFSQLTVRTRQRREVLREWPPRAGYRILM